MRYEVLLAIYQGCGGKADCLLKVAPFTEQLGIWKEELFRALDFLDHKGYIAYHGAGPVVSLTPRGIDYIERVAGRRKSIRTEGA